MLAIANMIPDLPVIPDTTDVIVDISRQSLRVASLIHEYTKSSSPGDSRLCLVNLLQVLRSFFTERTAKIKFGDFKSRIETCQKDCASLKDRFSIRVHVDTNIQVKEMKVEMKVEMGTFLLVCCCLFLIYSWWVQDV